MFHFIIFPYGNWLLPKAMSCSASPQPETAKNSVIVNANNVFLFKGLIHFSLFFLFTCFYAELRQHKTSTKLHGVKNWYW